jgi:hypothetical protein
MAITPGKLVKLYQADPDAYEDELQTLLGVTTDPETGYRRIQDPVIRPRSVSILDVGEAFVGREALRRIYDRRYGLAGGRARTATGRSRRSAAARWGRRSSPGSTPGWPPWTASWAPSCWSATPSPCSWPAS